MSSFKTQTGPGTIYEQLLHPGVDFSNPKPAAQDPTRPNLKVDRSNHTEPETEEQSGLDTNEDESKTLAPASQHPES